MPFANLPTELRHLIIEKVVATPFEPPATPTDIPADDWFYPLEERIRRNAYAFVREIGDYDPAIAFNTSSPWKHQYLPLLLVSKSFKRDAESVLGLIGSRLPPTLDVILTADGDLKVTWLLVPPEVGPLTQRLHLIIRKTLNPEEFNSRTAYLGR